MEKPSNFAFIFTLLVLCAVLAVSATLWIGYHNAEAFFDEFDQFSLAALFTADRAETSSSKEILPVASTNQHMGQAKANLNDNATHKDNTINRSAEVLQDNVDDFHQRINTTIQTHAQNLESQAAREALQNELAHAEQYKREMLQLAKIKLHERSLAEATKNAGQ